ncbi:ABC transporter substrate-binding protein [Fervidibacillus halotolerans]|uniref:ABC transporter substrate-binding protein n=1 Tax=Fervidibacillus halotolerans TaxID=2980027 RepID=A0A9E8M0P7_9BACI|nr:ABC transporter substrate-binding protein [Fervidibacillus halotolerans]WAA12770.1 ABC transporter substrate-binding protein [Fervidibacillus halotolerans]
MRKWQSIFVLFISLFFLIACGDNRDTTSKNDEGKTQSAEQDNFSGELSFYTSQPDEDAQKLVNAFNKKYPNIKVNIFRSGTEEVIAKIHAEKEAGKIQADVLLVADAVTFENLKNDDLLLPYKSKETEFIPEQFIDPQGMYTGTKVMATVLAVNTNHVKKIPDSWKVLTEGEAREKAIMPSPFYSGAAAYNLGIFTRQDDFTWDFYEKIKENGMAVTKGNGGVLKAVASGERAYGMVVDFLVLRAKNDGSPVEFFYPKEGVPVITEPIGILKDTKNEQAAKVFVDFVLSEEGQQLASQLGYTPIRIGVNSPEGLKSVDELNVLNANISELYHSRHQDKEKFGEIFGQ